MNFSSSTVIGKQFCEIWLASLNNSHLESEMHSTLLLEQIISWNSLKLLNGFANNCIRCAVVCVCDMEYAMYTSNFRKFCYIRKVPGSLHIVQTNSVTKFLLIVSKSRLHPICSRLQNSWEHFSFNIFSEIILDRT